MINCPLQFDAISRILFDEVVASVEKW